MSNNFRFHNSASNAQGWSSSFPLDDTQIASIKDPDGAKADKEITSIPSPFARINLVKNAFKEVLNLGLDGNTIFHKMVSHALDIGEILFNYNKYKNDIDIIVWDPASDLQELINSNNQSHQLLGRTLDLFLKQDASDNNFDQMGALFLLNYTKGDNPLNIIGGTSPASLFFTSANNFILDDFKSGNHQLLGDSYIGLHERDEEYIKYLWALKDHLPNFTQNFRYINDYLTEVFRVVDRNLKQDLNALDQNYYNNLPTLNIDGGGQVVQIHGHNLKTSQGKVAAISQSSGFRIAPEKPVQSNVNLPLVLPNETITDNILYVSDNWNRNDTVKPKNPNAINQRKLPFDGTKYPYLTISDFLEPVIIRTPYQIDKTYFETAGFEGDKGYLLPLKTLFFDYFSTDFLTKTNSQGQKNFEINSVGSDSVRVILRIPIQNNKSITFQRTYYNPVNKDQQPDFDESQNKGAILENEINLAISPFYEFPNGIQPEYNVSFYEGDDNSLYEGNVYDFEFVDKSNKKIDGVLDIQRRFKSEGGINLIAHKVDHNFAHIRLSHNFGSGVLMPKFEKVGGGARQFSFAIDFGTTNTHIEYKTDSNLPKPFELSAGEMFHLGTLIDADQYDVDFLEYPFEDMLPNQINKGERYNFPQRTASVYHEKTNFAKPLFSMGNITIPFGYEQETFTLNTEIQTNIKWNHGRKSDKIMEKFFEQLIKMIRNKVLLNNGNIHTTEILWTYPASMTTGQLATMSAQWQNIAQKYINPNIQVNSVCESLTPFYYYKNEKGKQALNKPLVTIDIGGGTSDIAVFQNNSPCLFTSYRFAADAIFGDNYNRSLPINGFVNKHRKKLTNLLDENNVINLTHVMESIRKRNENSNDVINALFSIENNMEVRKKQLDISFLKELKKDDEFRIIFLVFFVAHIYHLAKLLYKKRIDIPSEIIFSGTASKLLKVITPSDELLEEITAYVFKEVFGNKQLDIKIELAENPKELTSKGGVYLIGANINLRGIKDVLINNNMVFSSIKNKKYTAQNIRNFEQQTEDDYKDFLEVFFGLNEVLPFDNTFMISNDILSFTKDFLEKNAVNALKMGIDDQVKDLKSPDKVDISESFFFYPLVGSIGKLAFEIHKRF